MMTMLLMLPVMMVMPVKKVMKYIYYDEVSVMFFVKNIFDPPPPLGRLFWQGS